MKCLGGSGVLRFWGDWGKGIAMSGPAGHPSLAWAVSQHSRSLAAAAVPPGLLCEPGRMLRAPSSVWAVQVSAVSVTAGLTGFRALAGERKSFLNHG